jgi:chemotaxis protein histidine kinase CheA
MTAMPVTAAPDFLLELRRRFLTGLERRSSDLTAMLRGSADPESLMRMFHSLAGIGGTYGFHQVTDISRLSEALCQNAMAEQRAITVTEKQELADAIAKLRETAARPERLSVAA